jgi:hypothetical protein
MIYPHRTEELSRCVPSATPAELRRLRHLVEEWLECEHQVGIHVGMQRSGVQDLRQKIRGLIGDTPNTRAMFLGAMLRIVGKQMPDMKQVFEKTAEEEERLGVLLGELLDKEKK